jgi:hypothetical protein
MFEYAAGPTNVIDYTYVSKPSDAPSRQLCDNVKMKTPQGSGAQSFSTLGVAIILTVGGLLILGHAILELVVGTFLPGRGYKLSRWALDEKLQLQRLAFEGAGLGNWKAGSSTVPTTTEETTWAVDVRGDRRHPTFHEFDNEDKNAGTTVTQTTLSETASTAYKHDGSMDEQRDGPRAPVLPEQEFFDHRLSGPFNYQPPTRRDVD